MVYSVTDAVTLFFYAHPASLLRCRYVENLRRQYQAPAVIGSNQYMPLVSWRSENQSLRSTAEAYRLPDAQSLG